MTSYYAIETIGSGKDKLFAIKRVVKQKYSSPWIYPVNRMVYKTEQEAREAADEMGITIERCGDSYEII